MMGIVLSETYWACNKICNKYHLSHLVGVLFPHINDDARSKSLQIVQYKIPWKLGAELLRADWQTNMTKPIVAFLIFTNPIKNGYLFCNKHTNALCGQMLSYSTSSVPLPLVFKGFNHIPLLFEERYEYGPVGNGSWFSDIREIPSIP